MTCKILLCKPFDDDVQLTLNVEVEVMKEDENGVRQRTKGSSFSMTRKDVVRQLCQVNEDIALLSAIKGRIESKAVALLLTGSTVELERKFHAAGEVEGEHTFENEGFTTELKSLNLSERAIKLLDKAFEL